MLAQGKGGVMVVVVVVDQWLKPFSQSWSPHLVKVPVHVCVESPLPPFGLLHSPNSMTFMLTCLSTHKNTCECSYMYCTCKGIMLQQLPQYYVKLYLHVQVACYMLHVLDF